jgi:hypothetical protein
MPSSRLSRFLCIAGVCVVAAARGPVTSAQDVIDANAPAHIMYVEGSATLERDGQIDVVTMNAPVVAGDRLRTASGRVEILFPDATALDVDEESDVDLLSPTLLRISSGRAVLTVAGAGDPSGAVRYQVDTPAASIQTDGPGEFRITVLDRRGDETELAVVRGFARLTNDRGSASVRAGEQSVAFDGSAPTRTQIFNSARFDPFDRWIAERRSARVAAASSARYLPRDLQVYGGELDRDGSWRNEAPYGSVWYPSVTADWRPYYNGYWSAVPSYGWTWIGADVWSWPTHHYGRWGHNGRAWFWIPGRTWGPAWVSWAAASDYVSWCPLGFDGRPVFALSIGVGASWNGWTILPRGSFGYRGLRVDRYAVDSHRVPRSTPFVVSTSPPVGVPRAARTNQPGGANRGRPAYGERAASRDGLRSGGIPRDAGRTSPDPGFVRRTSPSPGPADSSRTAIPRSSGRRPDAVDSVRTPRATTPAARETPGLDRSATQPVPDLYRRRSADRGPSPNPTDPRPDARPAERAEPRYRATPPAVRQDAPAAAPQSAPPSAPVYRRSDRSPERLPDRPAERPVERSRERSAPQAAPPPRSAPESPGVRQRNGSDGGERAVPRHDTSGERSRGEGRRR